MKKLASLIVCTVLVAAFAPSASRAQPLVAVETVTVGDAANAPDSTGFGAVADIFAIGKYEVTISQYTMFLNTVAAVTSSSYIVNLWSPGMQSNLNSAGISRSGSGILGDAYFYSVLGPSGITPPGASSPGDRPVAYVSWFDAARFANWLNNGAGTNSSTETGAYTLNGAESGIYLVNPGATWFLPSESQWYKAAYYKGGGTNAGYWAFPTQSDTAPGNTMGGSANQANYYNGVRSVTQSGSYSSTQNYLTDAGVFINSASAYGTYDQGGNVTEWVDAPSLGGITHTRGGGWSGFDDAVRSSGRPAYSPGSEDYYVGFRVASVPEPSTYALLMLGAGLCAWSRRKIAR